MALHSAEYETRTDREQSASPPEFRVNRESEPSVVYFVGDDAGMVKIGFASDFHVRLRQLFNGSPVALHPLAVVIRGDRVLERAYHRRFASSRRHGEWFELTEELEQEIDRINAGQNPHYRPHRFRGLALPLLLTVMASPERTVA